MPDSRAPINRYILQRSARTLRTARALLLVVLVAALGVFMYAGSQMYTTLALGAAIVFGIAACIWIPFARVIDNKINPPGDDA